LGIIVFDGPFLALKVKVFALADESQNRGWAAGKLMEKLLCSRGHKCITMLLDARPNAKRG
jgi:hypothetical protein